VTPTICGKRSQITFFQKYGGLSFLLLCNYNLQIFSCGEFILWNNEATIIENHWLFWKSWVERGIYFIQDFLNSSGNFLTLVEFQTKFQIKTNFLQYFQLIAAIP